jgi:hypothetical protein
MTYVDCYIDKLNLDAGAIADTFTLLWLIYIYFM